MAERCKSHTHTRDGNFLVVAPATATDVSGSNCNTSNFVVVGVSSVEMCGTISELEKAVSLHYQLKRASDQSVPNLNIHANVHAVCIAKTSYKNTSQIDWSYISWIV